MKIDPISNICTLQWEVEKTREKGKCRKDGYPNQRVYKLGLRELENREQWDRKSSRECRYRFPGKRKGNFTSSY